MDIKRIEEEIKKWEFIYGDEDIFESECIEFAAHIAKIARTEAYADAYDIVNCVRFTSDIPEDTGELLECMRQIQEKLDALKDKV